MVKIAISVASKICFYLHVDTRYMFNAVHDLEDKLSLDFVRQ